jgi:uncharacterized protein with FMN-binding domain
MATRRQAPPTSPVRLGFGLASLALAVYLLVGFAAPQDGTVAGTSNGTGAGTGTGTGAGSGSGSATFHTTSGTKTIDGSVVNTRYGPVEVEVTVAGGKVTAVTAIALPSGGRSGAISGYAAPILSSEALTAQSAQIDLVSGATYTSDAYAQSLQSALDQAGG